MRDSRTGATSTVTTGAVSGALFFPQPAAAIAAASANTVARCRAGVMTRVRVMALEPSCQRLQLGECDRVARPRIVDGVARLYQRILRVNDFKRRRFSSLKTQS